MSEREIVDALIAVYRDIMAREEQAQGLVFSLRQRGIWPLEAADIVRALDWLDERLDMPVNPDA